MWEGRQQEASSSWQTAESVAHVEPSLPELSPEQMAVLTQQLDAVRAGAQS